jgi:hypothetical protein
MKLKPGTFTRYGSSFYYMPHPDTVRMRSSWLPWRAIAARRYMDQECSEYCDKLYNEPEQEPKP